MKRYDAITAKAMVEAHNRQIEDYINNGLVEALENDGFAIKNGKVIGNGAGAWFAAQRHINGQEFYKKARAIIDELKKDGFRVIIDMQSDKLTLMGV